MTILRYGRSFRRYWTAPVSLPPTFAQRKPSIGAPAAGFRASVSIPDPPFAAK